MDDKKIILKVNELNKTFKSTKAVKDISFYIKEGEIFGFLGQNGAGKSTTINMITTMLPITSGNIILDGYDIEMYPSKVRELIGIVFQQQTLDEKLTVEKNLIIHAKLYNVPKDKVKKRVDYVLDLVSLNDKRKEFVGALSGGQKRRVELARGLIHKPKVLFLDEPTTGLDPQTRADIWKYVLKLQKEQNMTIFLTTHYMDESEVCDRIAIMSEGVIVESGTPTELKEKLAINTLQFKSDNPKENIKIIKKEFKKINASSTNEVVTIESSFDQSITSLVEFIVKEKSIVAKDINISRPTMDDVFLSVVNKHKPTRNNKAKNNINNNKKSKIKLTPEQKEEQKKLKQELKEKDKKLKILEKIRKSEIKERVKKDQSNIKIKKDLKLSFTTVFGRELTRFFNNRAEFIISFIGPLLLIILFGILANAQMPGASFSESIAKVIPGTIGTTIVSAGIFQGISFIDDIDRGFMKEMLVSPIRRWDLALGKILGASVKVGFRGMFLFLLGFAFPVSYQFLDIFVVMIALIVSCFALISVSLWVATKITDVNAYQAFTSMLMMPLVFMNGTSAPPSAFPDWLQWIILINPASYITAIFNGVLDPNFGGLVVYSITITPAIAWATFIGIAILSTGGFMYSITKMHGSKEYKRSSR